MNKKQEILLTLSRLRKPLADFGVSDIGLFGSVVRGESRASSDIDILIDFDPNKENYSNFIQVCELLENSFMGAKLDIVSKNGLSPYIGPIILNEVVYA